MMEFDGNDGISESKYMQMFNTIILNSHKSLYFQFGINFINK